jgi:hypothetical protein
MLAVERDAAARYMIWACGWCVTADPQVWSTAVSPMRAERTFGAPPWGSFLAAECRAPRAFLVGPASGCRRDDMTRTRCLAAILAADVAGVTEPLPGGCAGGRRGCHLLMITG